MNLPQRLNTMTDDIITLDDFPDDEVCHACHGAGEGCVACQINELAMRDYYREVMAERMADER